GVAGLAPAADGRWQVVASEGGHVSFGPQAPDEFDIFAQLARDHGPISAETILSGTGMVRLLRALDPQSRPHGPRTIVAAALDREPAPLAAVQLFLRLLGRFAGDMALTFKALGGVYIAGGVACGLDALFDGPQFRMAF